MKYKINGREVTEEEFRAYPGKGITVGHAPGGHSPYWGTGFATLSASMPAHQAKEHADWVQSRGIKGIEVCGDGTVKASSPGNWRKYLAARGLADYSNAGAGQYKGSGGSIGG